MFTNAIKLWMHFKNLQMILTDIFLYLQAFFLMYFWMLTNVIKLQFTY